MSDDGAWSVVVIALLGNPFSPSYARARQGGGRPRALDFSALNVCVYGPAGSIWSLDERRIADADRTRDELALGASLVRWRRDGLVIDVDERATPFAGAARRATPIRGRIRLRPHAVTTTSLALDGQGQHRWWPVAPSGRIDVDLPEPGIRFTGSGYHDANAGDVPLEHTFARWSWSRAHVAREALTCAVYDVTCASGETIAHALAIDRRGRATPLDDLQRSALATTRWRLPRQTRGGAGVRARVRRELEDTPFYARSLVDTGFFGHPAVAVHEELSLDRFARSWVQFLLGFRMSKV